MSLIKRNKHWWVDIRIDGKRYRQSTGKVHKGDALEVYPEVVRQIRERLIAEPARRNFKDLQERYLSTHSRVHKAPKSIVRDESSFKHLAEFFGDMPVEDITPARISDYKALRRSQKNKKGNLTKPATLARELEVLRHALNLAVREWEWIELSPFEKVRIERPHNQVERWLTPEEEERLLKASPAWLQEIISFALNTGMRQDEILSLKWPQVDGTRRTVILLHTKNKEKRTIPINQKVLAILTARFGTNDQTGYVFPAPESGNKMNARNLLRAYYSARKKAQLEDVRFHDLRHTFATRLVQSGVDLYVVKELLGHKNITMTMRYAHHYPESLRHGVDILDGFGQKNAQSGHTVDTLGKKERATETVTL